MTDNDLREKFIALMTRCGKGNVPFSNDCGLQTNEMQLLYMISENCTCDSEEGINLNMQRIQERLQISRPAISYTLNTLEKKEYIVREIDPKDRRRISIHITAEGETASEQSMQQHMDMWNRLVEEFGEDNMNQLIQLLTRFFEILDKM